MKKLSELPNDFKLVIAVEGYDLEVQSKEDFVLSSDFLDRNKGTYPKVFIGVKEVVCFSFDSIFEQDGDVMYEDWDEEVYHECIKAGIDLKGIEAQINEVYEKNPSYYEGEEVDIES